MTIKYLVISGGGPTGLLTYGAASYLAKADFWRLADIKGIYGCSIGAYMGVIFTLGYEWDWLDDYFIKRPWEKLISSSAINIFDIYAQKGILNEQFFTDAIRPLLTAKGLTEEITLSEFYEFNKIDLHFYTTNINSEQLNKVDLSHTTHPSLSLIKALRMTMAVPIIFQPIFDNNACYIDGGLLNNFPLNDCIEQTKCEHNEILAFKNIWTEGNSKSNINSESSMLDFLLVILKKTQASIDSEPNQIKIKYTVQCLVDELSHFSKWIEALSQEKNRRSVIEKGYNQAKVFLDYIKDD